MNTIRLDAYNNEITTDVYPSHTSMNTHMNTNLIQMQVINKVMSNLHFLKTGDMVLDTIIMTLIQGLIISLITLIIAQIGQILTEIRTVIKKSITLTSSNLTNLYYYINSVLFRKSKVICKTIEIPYISETKDINELHKAVHWFLTNNEKIDYLFEQHLQFVFNKKITLENREEIKKNLSINKILTQDKPKTITYKNKKITYKLSKEIVTVYGDRDRKRENYKVILWTDVNEHDKIDILEDFSQHCLTEYINNLSSSKWTQMIYTLTDGEWKACPSNNYRKIDTIILKNDLKNKIKKDLDLFLNSEDWYKDRDIPYKRGYLFYGLPGTGKTSMIKGIATYSKRHIHYLILSEIKTDSQLIELLKKINYETTILVIEDIDAMTEIVKSREFKADTKKEKEEENVTISGIINAMENKNNKYDNREESKLTLSGLLNALDGVFTTHGRILIMTTNHPEVLDEALIRAGRCDSKYVFGHCDKQQIKEMYYLFFDIEPEIEQINNIEDNVYSPAHISSVFQRYRNTPEIALLHLDDVETKITSNN